MTGRLPKDPSAVGSLKKASQVQRTGHDKYRLTNITIERCRTDPNPLAVRFTNFRQQFTDPMEPGPVTGRQRPRRGQVPVLGKVGQLPED